MDNRATKALAGTRREPSTQTLKASEARQQFSQVLNKVFRKEALILVEKSGIPVAAIVSTEDLQRLERYDRERVDPFQVLDEIWARNRAVDPDEVERDVAEEIAAMRAERRAL